MKNKLFNIIAALILSLSVSIVNAQNEPYVELSSDGKTLTFKYGEMPSSGSFAEVYNLGDGGWLTTANKSSVTKVVFDESFKDARPPHCSYWFYDFSYITTIIGIENLRTSEATDLSFMFYNCYALENLDMTHFQTGQVTNMSYMFVNCRKLTSLDLSLFYTSKVTTMENMFYGCSSLKTIKVGSLWITDNVENSSNMLYGCSELIGGEGTPFSPDYIDKTYARIDGKNGSTGYFTVGSEPYAELSSDGTTLTFQYGVMPYNSNRFYGLEAGKWLELDNKSPITNVVFDKSFSAAVPLSCSWWFSNFTGLTTITGLEYLNTSEVTNMQYMFYNCWALTSLDLTHFYTPNLTDTRSMFSGCYNLKTIKVGCGWNVDMVTESDNMFADCDRLAGGNGTSYSSANTDKTYARVDASGTPGYLTAGIEPYVVLSSDGTTLTFKYGLAPTGDISVYNLASGDWLDLGKGSITDVVFDETFKDVRPTSCGWWFSNFVGLTTITGIENLNISQVKNMSYMFFNCWALPSIDLRHFNTANVEDMQCMFYNCSKLETIKVGSGWNTDAVTNSYDMFYNCSELVGGKGTEYTSAHTDKTYARMDGGPTSETPGYLTDGRVAFAELSDDGKTLTFAYGVKPESGDVYDLNRVQERPGWYDYAPNITAVVFESSFAEARPKSCYDWFANMYDLESITGMKEYLITDNVTDMEAMFTDCQKLESIDFSSFNTAKVENMKDMFVNFPLKTLDLSSFNTSSVKNMTNMFYGSSNLTTIIVGEGWKTGSVTTSTDMFKNCSALIGNGGATVGSETDRTNANTTSTGYLTEGDYKIFYQWADESPKTYHEHTPSTFSGSNEVVISNPERDGHQFLYWTRVSADGTQIGESSSSLKIAAGDLGNRIYQMHWALLQEYATYNDGTLTFAYGLRPTTGDVYDIPTNMSNIGWSNAGKSSSITTVIFESTISPVSCVYWFDGCENLENIIGLDKLNTENVTSMDYMFNDCKKLTALNVSGFNTGELVGMQYMFGGCEGLTELDLGSWDMSKVTDMYATFSGCKGLESLKLNTTYNDTYYAAPTNTGSTFSDCSSLKVLDFSGFNMYNVTNAGSMFSGCKSLTTIKVLSEEKWNLTHPTLWANQTQNADMFKDCYNLIGDKGTLYENGYTSGGRAHVDKHDGTTSGYLTTGNYKIFYDKEAADDEIKLETIAGAPTEYVSTSGAALPTLDESDENGEFKGWVPITRSAEGIVTGSPTASIVNGEVGNRIYGAQWENEKYVYYENGTLHFCFDANKSYCGSYVYSFNKGSNAPGWLEHSNDIVDVVVEAEFSPSSCYKWFAGCSNLTVLDLTNIKTTNITNLESMFDGCTNLTAILVEGYDENNGNEEGDGTWVAMNTYNNGRITESDNMFRGCNSLISYLGNWLSRFDDIDKTYAYANDGYYDGGLLTQDNYLIFCYLNGGDELNGESPYGVDYPITLEYKDDPKELGTPTKDGSVFVGWARETTEDNFEEPEHDVTVPANSGNYRFKAIWAVKQGYATYADGTLTFAYGAKPAATTGMTVFDLNTYDSNTGTSTEPGWYDPSIYENVTTVVFDQTFEEARPKTCCKWFCNMINLESITGLDYLKTDEVKDMQYMFTSCQQLESLDLSGFDTRNVEDMQYMFVGCHNLKTLDISSFNTEKVKDMESMFGYCFELTAIKVGSGWKTSGLTESTSGMFDEDTKLIGNGGAWVTSKDKTNANTLSTGYLTSGNYKVFLNPDGGTVTGGTMMNCPILKLVDSI